MSIYSNGEYLKNNPTWHQEDAFWKTEQIYKILNRNSLKPKTVIDIGCGTGSILRELSKKLSLKNCLGYEPFPNVLRMAKQHNPCLALTRTLPSDNFDLALLIDVIEHIDDPRMLMKKTQRISKNQIFNIPLALSLQARLRRKTTLEESRRRTGHLHEFTRESAIAFLEQNGFSILDQFLVEGAVLTPKKSSKQKFLNIFRKAFFLFAPNLTSKILGGYSLLVLTK